MDRLALALVTLGLTMILVTVATVLGGGSTTLSAYGAAAAALAGATMISGLVILERRAFSIYAPLPVAKAALPRALPAGK
ncbi:hypothetical protein [Muricoccus radiodurans]|uniref:hypothetical protein n=1 Tax=Muricoccus radiodurans TaxID=2231721 RepID=UPI003CF62893